MLKILQRRLPVELNSDQAVQVQQSLQARFNSLLAGVRLEYLRRLGLDSEPRALFAPPEDASLAAGEIFMPEPGTIFYIKYANQDRCLEAGAISNQAEADFADFFGEVRDCVLQLTRQNKDWEAMGPAMTPPEGARPANVDVSEKELEAARELMSEQSRRLLAQLASAESTPFNQLDLHEFNRADLLLGQFEDLDLIRKDYAVIDRKTGQQILRVPSRASLEEASQKFFIGGTPITEDTVDEVISCTPFCRSLLLSDQWLLLLLLGTLKNLGVDSDSIQVCQSADTPTRVFLTLNQQRFLVVLSNRRLTLDDSYLVSAQVAAYGLEDVIVLSTDKTSTLMKHHLQQTNDKVTFNFVDSLEDLEDSLRSILLERQRDYIRSLLDPLAELTPVRIQELVIRKMAPGPSNGEVHSTQYPDPPEIPSQEEDSLPDFQPPPMDVPNTEDDESDLPELPSPMASIPPPPTTELPEDEAELPAPDEGLPEIQMPDLVPDLPAAEEFVPDIPSPVEASVKDE
ncbi:MAG: hypothetical protein AB7S38_23020 [Vulcanimicrobiota bacterium]